MTTSNSEPLNKSLESEKSEVWKLLMKYGQARQKAQPSAVGVIRVTREAEAELQALISEQLEKQREDIRSKLPEKLGTTKEESTADFFYGLGNDTCLDQITKILDSHTPKTTKGKG